MRIFFTCANRAKYCGRGCSSRISKPVKSQRCVIFAEYRFQSSRKRAAVNEKWKFIVIKKRKGSRIFICKRHFSLHTPKWHENSKKYRCFVIKQVCDFNMHTCHAQRPKITCFIAKWTHCYIHSARTNLLTWNRNRRIYIIWLKIFLILGQWKKLTSAHHILMWKLHTENSQNQQPMLATTCRYKIPTKQNTAQS